SPSSSGWSRSPSTPTDACSTCTPASGGSSSSGATPSGGSGSRDDSTSPGAEQQYSSPTTSRWGTSWSSSACGALSSGCPRPATSTAPSSAGPCGSTATCA